jgi:hypothetical protein
MFAAERKHLFGMHSRLVVFWAVLSEEDRTFYRITDYGGEDRFPMNNLLSRNSSAQRPNDA